MLRNLATAPEPFAPPDRDPACRGCRQARLTMQCAACGRRTAVVALASSVCHIEYCEQCWQMLQTVRLGTRALQAWPVGEYVELQAHRERKRPLAVSAAAQKPRRAHRRTRRQDVTPQPLPWGEGSVGAA
jgi:hypothetical protein